MRVQWDGEFTTQHKVGVELSKSQHRHIPTASGCCPPETQGVFNIQKSEKKENFTKRWNFSTGKLICTGNLKQVEGGDFVSLLCSMRAHLE